MPSITVKKLLQEVKRLRGQLEELEEQDPKNWPQRAQENAPEEEADESERGSKVTAIRKVVSQKLSDVKIALRKARSGSYGVCDRCGKKIDPARLKVIPDAKYCLDCAEELENTTA